MYNEYVRGALVGRPLLSENWRWEQQGQFYIFKKWVDQCMLRLYNIFQQEKIYNKFGMDT